MDHHDFQNMRFLDNFQCIKTGDVVVDVGACYGTYTKYFVNKLLGTGKIYSVELSPSNCGYLNRDFGGLSNVEIINSAVSDNFNEVSYFQGPTPETFNIIGHDTSFQQQDIAGKVQSTTLNELLKDEPKVKLVKIDVEGSELNVLRGMSEVYDKIEYILLENHFDEDWPEIRKIILQDYGFECYNIERQTEVTHESPRPYQCLCQKK